MIKKFLVLALLVSPVLHAQVRVLAGATGGSSLGNLSLGPAVGLEVPFGGRLELDLSDTFSPFESHVALGHGWADVASAGGHVWLTPGFGLNGSFEHSEYHVTGASKGYEYALGGVTWRRKAWGAPARLSLDYLRELHDGISADGTETDHVQGGEFTLEARLGCSGPLCVRMTSQFGAARVLTQSNPQCDGSFGGPVTCPRPGVWAGIFQLGLLLEIPRRRGHESDTW